MNNEKFTAEIKDVSVYGINKILGVSEEIDIDCGKPKADVYYEMHPESREWGIKSIYIYIEKLTCSIEWEVDTMDFSQDAKADLIKAGGKNYGNSIEGTIEVDTKIELKGKSFEITNEVDFEKDGAFRMNDVEIDLENMTIIIS